MSTFDAGVGQLLIAKEVEYTEETSKKVESSQQAKYRRRRYE